MNDYLMPRCIYRVSKKSMLNQRVSWWRGGVALGSLWTGESEGSGGRDCLRTGSHECNDINHYYGVSFKLQRMSKLSIEAMGQEARHRVGIPANFRSSESRHLS